MSWEVGPELRALAALCKELNLAGVSSEMRDGRGRATDQGVPDRERVPVSTINDLAARLSTLLSGLRSEFVDWTIHRTESGRWLAIRSNVCIRAHNAAELRKRIRRHLAETTQDLGGERT